MLKKENRFHSRNAVRNLLKKGKQERAGPLTIRYQKAEEAHSRVAVVVSKKVSKKAVVRNRIRRRVFALFREMLEGFDSPHDIAVIVYSDEVAKIPSKELRDTLQSCLKRVGVLQ